MIALEALGSLAWRHWKLILAGAIALGLATALFLARSDARHAREALTAEKASHALDIANFKAASAKAIADNLADVRAKEDDGAKLVETKQHDLEAQLADARAAATRYAGVRRCETAANPGSAGEASLSEAPRPASDTVGTGGMSVVDERDLQACSAAVVKARGWQDWYGALRERYNTETP